MHRWFNEIWNDRRIESMHELMTPESVCHLEDGPMKGPHEFRQRQYDPFTAAFPDVRVNIEATLAQGEQVVVRWTAAGTHTGHGLGFPATGKAVSFRGISWIIVRNGRMMEGWQSSNVAEVLQGLATPHTA